MPPIPLAAVKEGHSREGSQKIATKARRQHLFCPPQEHLINIDNPRAREKNRFESLIQYFSRHAGLLLSDVRLFLGQIQTRASALSCHLNYAHDEQSQACGFKPLCVRACWVYTPTCCG